jgi:hypothetical protein
VKNDVCIQDVGFHQIRETFHHFTLLRVWVFGEAPFVCLHCTLNAPPFGTCMSGILRIFGILPGACSEFWISAVHANAGEGQIELWLAFSVFVGGEQAES